MAGMRRFHLFSFVLPLLFALSLATQVDAATLMLEWDPPAEASAAGYIILYGTRSGVYTTQIDVGDVTTRAVTGLADSTVYFFTVKAYNQDGALSEHSNELRATTPAGGGAVTPPPGGTPPGGETLPGGNILPPTTPGTPNGASTPDGVTATFRTNRYIDIAWLPAAGSPDGYRVEIGAAYGDTAISGLTRDAAITFDMTDLPAVTYFIRVRPVYGARYGFQSHELTVSPASPIPPADPAGATFDAVQCVAPPRAPRQLGASAKAAAVALNWRTNAGAAPSGYVLQVGSAPGLQNVLVAHFEAGVTGVTASAANAAYALRLAAVNACGSSVWAPETILYVGVSPLPGMPRAVSQEVSGGLVTLRWERPATGGRATRYLIEAVTPFGPFAYDTGNTGTGFANANTPPGQYVVTVRAGNATGFGPASAPVLLVVP